MMTKRNNVLVAVLSLAALLVVASSVLARVPEAARRDDASTNAVVPTLLQYQGRLTDPGTGDAVSDGVYTMSFRLYDTADGDTAVWSETKDVSLQGGVFNTALGDVTGLDLHLFNGDALWLGVKVGADAEASPRQQIFPVAYAMSLVPGAMVAADGSEPTLIVSNAGTGPALQVGGSAVVDGDLQVGGSFSGAHNHTGATIVDGTIDTADLARDAVTTSKIANGNVTSDDIQDITRKISFPAHALNHAPGTIIQDGASGLLWQANYAQPAFVSIARPVDWDGTSDVTMRLYFFTTTSSPGYVDFFIRPRAYNHGDTWGDAGSLGGTPVYVSSTYAIREQRFTIPASRFGTKSLWVISIQRQGSASTYPDDVYLMSVELEYNAVR
jgi:hypothetical protein